MANPEPSIRGDWTEFIIELDKLFGEPDLAQSSECALRSLKMQENHHINKYMIEFSEHAAYTGWNDVALYGKFYRGLAERLKDQLLTMDQPCTLDQLKIDALKCDNRYWERQHEKAPIPTTCTKLGPSSAAPTLASPQSKTPTFRPSNREKTEQPWKDLGNILNADGKLMEAEKEWRRSKGLCFYCGEAPEKCRHNAKPPMA